MTLDRLFAIVALLIAGSSCLQAAEFNLSDTQQHNRRAHPASQDMVVVDVVASESTELAIKDLQALGMVSHDVLGKHISGLLPASALEAAKRLGSINQIRVNRTITAAGDLTSEGDTALRSADARQAFEVDGTGVSVAVISDSYNCLGGEEDDRASNDLPGETIVVEEALVCEGLVDEGRAIMHLVHDIAPGARLLFFSGTNGYARTANGIIQLVDEYNVDIIVDDAKLLTAPFFQKGVLVKAVEQAVARGVVYVTAAGNSARLSYQSPYRNHYNPALDLNTHDFDASEKTDVYQRISLPEGAAISLIFQWDSPAFSVSGIKGATTDLDIHLVNTSDSIVAESTEGNMGRDPVEILEFYNPPGSGENEFNLLISKVAGPDPTLIKYILFNRFNGEIAEYATDSGTIFGHANAETAITVGAGNYQETPAYGVEHPLLEYFSSAGGDTPWLFDAQGDRLETPYTPRKPDIIAPDNVNTPFELGEDTDGDGKPNFRGTSAAAPHIAGVAALMLNLNSDLTPQDVKTILYSTAVDVLQRNDTDQTAVGTAYDFDSGHGLADAYKALSMATDFDASPHQSPAESSEDTIAVYQQPIQAGALGLILSMLLISLLLARQDRQNRHPRYFMRGFFSHR